jgi:hypothetical protein
MESGDRQRRYENEVWNGGAEKCGSVGVRYPTTADPSTPLIAILTVTSRLGPASDWYWSRY